MSNLNAIQIFTLGIAIMLSGIILFRIKKNNFKRLLDYPRLYWSLALALHMIVFYVTVGFTHTDPNTHFFESWSSILRLHSVITFFYIEIVEIYYWRKKKNG